jgi:hypothetical protein
MEGDECGSWPRLRSPDSVALRTTRPPAFSMASNRRHWERGNGPPTNASGMELGRSDGADSRPRLQES